MSEPTPRTNAWFGVTDDYEPRSDDESGMNLCRELERELSATQTELAKRNKCSYIGPMRDCPTHGESATLAAQRTALLALSERIRREGMQGVANEIEEIVKA